MMTSNDDASRFCALVLLPPVSPLELPFQPQCDPCEAQKHRNLDKGSDCCCECLIRVDSKYGYGYSNRQLLCVVLSVATPEERNGTDKIVATRRECLGNCHFIPEYLLPPSFFFRQIIHESKGRSPHYHEIKDHGHENSEHWSQVVDNVVSLIRKQDEDGIKQTK